jgi:hypothetical protein
VRVERPTGVSNVTRPSLQAVTVKRPCPSCDSMTIPVMRLMLFRHPHCVACRSRVGFTWASELMFHLLTNMPIALISLVLILTEGFAVGAGVGLGLLCLLVFLFARMAPLQVKAARPG